MSNSGDASVLHASDELQVCGALQRARSAVATRKKSTDATDVPRIGEGRLCSVSLLPARIIRMPVWLLCPARLGVPLCAHHRAHRDQNPRSARPLDALANMEGGEVGEAAELRSSACRAGCRVLRMCQNAWIIWASWPG